MPSVLSLTLVLLIGCSAPEQEEVPPWETLNFLERSPTALTVINTTTDTLVVWWGSRADEAGREEINTTLLPADSIVLSTALYDPVCAFLSLDDRVTIRPYLLPGIDRRVAWTGSDLKELSPIYRPLRRLSELIPHQASTTPVTGTILEIIAHYEWAGTQVQRYVDSLRQEDRYPPWLLQLIDREARLAIAVEMETIRGYRRMAYLDTLPMPDTLERRLRAYLTDSELSRAPSYRALKRWRTYLSIGDTLSPEDRRSKLQLARVGELVNTEEIAAFAETELHDPRFYGAKEEVLERALARLPPAYRTYLTALQDTLQAASADRGGVATLLATPLRTITEARIVPAQAFGDGLTLYKFWFPGCVPCIKQYPFERQLLRRNPTLKLVYIGYETERDRWRGYVQTHQLPTTHQLYLTASDLEKARAALGLLGAPRYLLVSGAGEVICRNCPKPEDEDLAELIRNVLSG